MYIFISIYIYLHLCVYINFIYIYISHRSARTAIYERKSVGKKIFMALCFTQKCVLHTMGVLKLIICAIDTRISQ